MIKNIYDKDNKQYRHEYFCDNCFAEITYTKVYRNERLMKHRKIDLCYKCYKYFEIEKEKIMNKCIICETPTPMNKPLC